MLGFGAIVSCLVFDGCVGVVGSGFFENLSGLINRVRYQNEGIGQAIGCFCHIIRETYQAISMALLLGKPRNRKKHQMMAVHATTTTVAIAEELDEESTWEGGMPRCNYMVFGS